MRTLSRIILVVLVVIPLMFLSASIFAQLYSTRTFGTYGSVKAIGVEVYWDVTCTQKLASIDWGLIEPGSNSAVTCYIRNEGNSASTLYLDTTNWNPLIAENYLTLSWDYNEQNLSPDEVIQVTFTLSLSANVEGITGYSFDITILGSG